MEYRKLSTTVDYYGNIITPFSSYTTELPPPPKLVRTLNLFQIEYALDAIKRLKVERLIVKTTLDYIMYIEKNKNLYNIYELDVRFIKLFPSDYFNP